MSRTLCKDGGSRAGAEGAAGIVEPTETTGQVVGLGEGGWPGEITTKKQQGG